MPGLNTPLRRSRSDRILAGVCGGLARYLGMDSTVVRVVYVLASVLTAAFPGILVYLIFWLIVPDSD
jgi:phage shock protein C